MWGNPRQAYTRCASRSARVLFPKDTAVTWEDGCSRSCSTRRATRRECPGTGVGSSTGGTDPSPSHARTPVSVGARPRRLSRRSPARRSSAPTRAGDPHVACRTGGGPSAHAGAASARASGSAPSVAGWSGCRVPAGGPADAAARHRNGHPTPAGTRPGPGSSPARIRVSTGWTSRPARRARGGRRHGVASAG